MPQIKPIAHIINEINFPIDIDIPSILFSIVQCLKIEPHIEISIKFVNDEEMTEYNKLYNGYAKSTDVLSFVGAVTNPQTGRLILGDILINFPFIQKSAIESNLNPQSELTLMVIHGTLHLLGYDHDTPENKKSMWKIQNDLLDMNNASSSKLEIEDEFI